jgi:hypothetical protein
MSSCARWASTSAGVAQRTRNVVPRAVEVLGALQEVARPRQVAAEEAGRVHEVDRGQQVELGVVAGLLEALDHVAARLGAVVEHLPGPQGGQLAVDRGKPEDGFGAGCHAVGGFDGGQRLAVVRQRRGFVAGAHDVAQLGLEHPLVVVRIGALRELGLQRLRRLQQGCGARRIVAQVIGLDGLPQIQQGGGRGAGLVRRAAAGRRQRQEQGGAGDGAQYESHHGRWLSKRVSW